VCVKAGCVGMWEVYEGRIELTRTCTSTFKHLYMYCRSVKVGARCMKVGNEHVKVGGVRRWVCEVGEMYAVREALSITL